MASISNKKLIIKFESDTIQDAVLIRPSGEQDSLRDRDDLQELDKIKVVQSLNGSIKMYGTRGGKKVRTVIISPHAYDALRLEYQPILEQPDADDNDDPAE